MGRAHLLLLICTVLLRMQAALTQIANETTFGRAYLNSDNFPVPPDFRVIFQGRELLCSSRYVAKRTEVEKAVNIVQNNMFSYLDLEVRYKGFSAHRAATPGKLDEYSCDICDWDLFARNASQGAGFFLDAAVVYQISRFAEARFQELSGYPIRAAHVAVWRVAKDSNITKVDTVDILSRIELSGPGLAPFTYDKQFLLTFATFDSSRAADVPVATVNMSNWAALALRVEAAAAAGSVPARRRLRATEDNVVSVEIWLSLYPSRNATAAATWQALAPGIKNITAAAGFPMMVTFRNATIHRRTKGAALDVISQEIPTEAEPALQQRKASGGGPGGGTIAAISAVAAACLTAAAVAIFAVVWLRRRQKQKDGKGDPEASESSGHSRELEMANEDVSASALGLPAGSEGNAPLQRDVTLCRKPDGSLWLLGTGSSGKVYKALWRGPFEVAVKQVGCAADERLLNSLHNEFAIMQKVSCNQNVVQFYGLSLGCSDEPTADCPMLIMEFMEGGDLRQALKKQPEEFAWRKRGQTVALDIARGMHFLHSSGVIHRDIKSSNVLLTRDGTAKIADVGLAIMAQYFSGGGTGAAGTFTHAAPELLMGSRCSPKVDVYSFGVVLWEIVTGQHPVRGELREVRPEECPPAVAALLAECISTDANERPTSAEIVDQLASMVIENQQDGLLQS